MAFLDQPYTVQTRHADLYVEQVGPEDAPAVLYLHGGPGYNAFSFRDLVGEELEPYRMLYADQRGAGRSYTDAPFDLDALADDVRALLDALRIERAALLAHGWGALIAVRAAGRHPERVSRLVLVNPWLSMPLLARTLQRTAATLAGQADEALPPESSLAEGEAPDPEELVERAFGLVSGKQLWDALEFPDPAGRLRLEHADSAALFGPQETEAPDGLWSYEVQDELAALALPSVVLAGKDDGTSYPDQVEVALTRAPGALFSLLDAGHYPWIDDPEGFVPVLRQALGEPAAAAEGRPEAE